MTISTSVDVPAIWRVLGSSSTTDEPMVVIATDTGWEAELEARLKEIAAGKPILLVCESRLLRAALNLARGRSPRFASKPGYHTILRTLYSLGCAVQATYLLWPSAERPRIAYQGSDRRLGVFVQRAGIIGGGGTRLWARWLARSFLFTPVAAFGAPAKILVLKAQGAKIHD